MAASLRRQGLAGTCLRLFPPATTAIDLDAAVPKDLVKRRFDMGRRYWVWTFEITHRAPARLALIRRRLCDAGH